MKSAEFITEITRRNFLKGVGAAGLGSTQALAAPFRHGQNIDPMTDKAEGQYSTVTSDDGSAVLYIQWNSGVWLQLNQGRFNIGWVTEIGRAHV